MHRTSSPADVGRPRWFVSLVAGTVFLATAPKIGPDTNYQVEMTTLLVVYAAVAL